LPKIHYDHQALQLLGVPGARLATGLLQLDVSESTIGELLRNDLGLDDRAIGEALTAARRLSEEDEAADPAATADAAGHPRTRADDVQPEDPAGD
jgi:hypothetical protein